ncbi:MAG TPA: restriction endonuclease subunit S [Flavobacteriales bacterium]|nr:restriction endonuclease subunit S [Flavobacteriales bacterium]
MEAVLKNTDLKPQMAKLGTYVAKMKALDPRKFPDEEFELFSVPSHAEGKPEVALGKTVGASKQMVEDDTVLLCKINPRINRTWVVSSHTGHRKIASSEWMTFPPSPDFLPQYLGYYLQQDELRDHLALNASGVGGSLMRAKPGLIKDYPFPLFPLPEQRRIVSAIETQLGRLDAAVARLHAAKARLKRYKQAVLKAAVEGRLTEEWREKNSDVEDAERIVARIQANRAATERTGRKTKTSTPAELDLDSLPSLPEGWMWSTLPQLGELNRGKSKHRPRDDKRLYDGPYPFVQTGDVRYANGLLTEYTATYSEFGLAQSRLWPAGTLCITIAANIADTAVLEFDACFPDSVVGFIPEEDSIDVHFAELFIRTVKQDIERYAPATAQKNINLEVLRDVAIALPPRAEQKEIMRVAGDVLTTIDEMESTLDAQLLQSTRLRQAVLKRAFEGRLG